MPSRRTHDQITLWSLPLVAALTFGQTREQQPDFARFRQFLIRRADVWPRLGYLLLPVSALGMVQTDLAPVPKKPAPPLFFVPRPSHRHCFANLVPRYLDRGFRSVGIGNGSKNWELRRELAGCGFQLWAIDLGTPHRNFSRLHRSRIGRYEPLSERLGRLGLQKI